MRGRLGDKARLHHILDAIAELEDYLIDTDFEFFMDNSMVRFACIKQLEIIGEASDHISGETKSKFPEVQWAQIKGMRNVLIHEYFGMDTTIVWEIIRHDVPILKLKVQEMLKSL